MNVAQNEAFRLSVQNTARFLLISVPLLFLVSLLLAYYINTQIVRKGLVKAVLLFPMILPVSTTTLFCRILFDNAGILNGAFQKLGMDTPVSYTHLDVYKRQYDILKWNADFSCDKLQ